MTSVIMFTILCLIPIVLLHIIINKSSYKFFNANRHVIAKLLEEEGQTVTEELIDFSIEEMVTRLCNWYLILVCVIIILSTLILL